MQNTIVTQNLVCTSNAKLSANTNTTSLIKKFEGLIINFSENIGTARSIIIHTVIFISVFGLAFFGVQIETIMLALTTAISLEAIYLSLFIQMSVNRSNNSIEEVIEDIEDIDNDINLMHRDIDDISDDVEELETKISNEVLYQVIIRLEKQVTTLEQKIKN